MNQLKADKQEAVIRGLVEGASIRSVERMVGVHRDTVMRLGVKLGNTCERLLDVMMRDLPCQRLELDEVWCYVGKKQRHVRDDDDPMQVGDFWTWVCLDAETKLVPAFRVGKRDAETAHDFIEDVASRLANRVGYRAPDSHIDRVPVLTRTPDSRSM